MSPSLMHALVSAGKLRFSNRRFQRVYLFLSQAHFISRFGQPNGPHARVEAFLDVGQRVANFNKRFQRISLEQDRILKAHEWMRPPSRNLRRTYRGIRGITAALRLSL